MRVVIQRVIEASVKVEGELIGEITQGMLVLLGVEASDGEEDIDWLCRKLLQLRIFNDKQGKMNLSLQDIGGAMLIISQFTLHGSTRKGNRPSFINAAKPEIALPLYEAFINKVEKEGVVVETGRFGADMKVSLVNDGPVTLIIDSKNRE
jgi:D-tyrosyl-tRNA(Tyr) deacylase